MIPLHELLNRIRWDPEFGRGEFTLAYLDKMKHELVRVPLTAVHQEPDSHFCFRGDRRGRRGAQHSLPPREGSMEGRRTDLAAGTLRVRADAAIIHGGRAGKQTDLDPSLTNFREDHQMQKIIIAVFATLFAANMAFAADASCEARAAEKKLAGAAKNSFMKKCEKEAKAVAAPAASPCAAKAAEKKLAGAAKNSFMKKCEADAKASK